MTGAAGSSVSSGSGSSSSDTNGSEGESARAVAISDAGGTLAGSSWRGTYEFNLTARELRRGIVMWGDAARARRAMARLLQGQPLRMSTVGGSITKGHNAAVWGKTDYSARVFNWVRTAFPNASHELINGAVGGTPSTYFATCIEWHIPAEPDIVILENNVNDGTAPPNSPVRRAHERLIRKLLGLPSRPAVLELSFFPYTVDFNQSQAPYRSGGEDEFAAFASFYRLPWIAIRSLAWGGTPETALDPTTPEARKYADIWVADLNHPTDKGHQWTADMIVHWMQTNLEDVERHPLEPQDEADAHAPLSMPLYKDNFEGGLHTCLMAGKFKDIVTHHDAAFEWKGEGDPQAPKYGYISMQPGSTLTAVVSTNVGNKFSSAGNVTLGVAHLKSYEHMGTFRVECVAGCVCNATVEDGHWDRHESQMQLVHIPMAPSDACTVRVTVLRDTRSGAHKVKIMGLIISEVPSSHIFEGKILLVRFGTKDSADKGTLNYDENF